MGQAVVHDTGYLSGQHGDGQNKGVFSDFGHDTGHFLSVSLLFGENEQLGGLCWRTWQAGRI